MTSTKRRLFGTDGIRGKANASLTVEIALRLGQAAGLVFTRGTHRHKVIIGKDTRRSGYMIEDALVAGFTSAGMDVLLTGPIPTPGLAALTLSMRADLGVMITASHNPFEDNGIKLFGPDGYKLTDEQELEIEALVLGGPFARLPTGADIGKAERIEDGQGRCVEYVKRSFPRKGALDGIRIALDCAHGAAYQVAPRVFEELGADVFPIGVSPDGTNINAGCGSTSPKAIIEAVYRHGAHIGIALDGDADRVLLVDEKRGLVDGDQMLATISTDWQKRKLLAAPVVVGTILSNLGLERYLEGIGITLARAPVGDRYVLEEMRRRKANLGGEESGHIIMTDYSSTGDGLIAALQVLAVMQDQNRPLSEIGHLYEPYPQVKKNVPVNGAVLENDVVKDSIRKAGERVEAGGGRLVVRPSGTEPLVRIMAEGENRALLTEIVAEVESALVSG